MKKDELWLEVSDEQLEELVKAGWRVRSKSRGLLVLPSRTV